MPSCKPIARIPLIGVGDRTRHELMFLLFCAPLLSLSASRCAKTKASWALKETMVSALAIYAVMRSATWSADIEYCHHERAYASSSSHTHRPACLQLSCVGCTVNRPTWLLPHPPHTVDGYSNPTGFKLTYADQVSYNKFLATTAHSYGLAAGLKNDVDQIKDLVGSFDFAINEQCNLYKECGTYAPFKAGEGTEALHCMVAHAVPFSVAEQHKQNIKHSK